jgi:Animal haem peroxidase
MRQTPEALDFRLTHRPWYERLRLFAMLELVNIRNELRKKNLHDTEQPPLATTTEPVSEENRHARTCDGTWNDLKCPHMGAAGTRFGRNVPVSETFPDQARLLTPNPRVISQELMTRHEFQPATILNLLAASWIQFMVHDWFVHKKGTFDDAIEVPLADADTWHERPMRVPKSVPDASSDPTRPPAYVNENSHWWDASQIYGCTLPVAKAIRQGTDGKILAGTNGRLPLDPQGLEITGFTENGWIGLSMLHGLFALEHNAICDRLKQDADKKNWTDEQLYVKARLINTALMAKIHTIEWTPAILPHEVIGIAMETNWHGLLKDQRFQDLVEFVGDNEILGGIVGSKHDHHTAPYSLTEEFVAVYRMHPLMPDTFTFRAVSDGHELGKWELPEVSGRAGRKVFDQIDVADLFYSFGVMHPGAVRLHNYPKHLQNLTRDNGERFDLATVEILRDRERGVPRYNQFRRLIHKDPVKSFEELTDNAEWREEIRRVYNNDIEQVDTLVGLLAEPLPKGFGFSETAFRIFVLMASRRLKSDRFFTDDYTPEIYTQTGLDYIEKNSMLTVLLRHYPSLAPALVGVTNAFKPWRAVS